MRSFAVELEPSPTPRLAAVAALVHGLAALGPWIARVPPFLALPLSLISLAAIALTLTRLPGRHCSLARLRLDGRGCRARLRGSHAFVPAELGANSRAYPDLVVLDIRVGGRRLGWLLPRGSVPPAAFRRLKARVRHSC
jgi:hypothetical protein